MNITRKAVSLLTAVALASTLVVASGTTALALDDSVAAPQLKLSEKSSIFYGDVNYDSDITAVDALLVLQASVGKTSLTSDQIDRADVDADSAVASPDALLLLQKAVKLGVKFQAQTNSVFDELATKQRLSFDGDGNFRILQVSDVQDATTVKAGTKQRLETMIKSTNPDLVVFTGDNLWPVGVTNKDAMVRYLNDMVGYCEENQIPWCHVYGNHDNGTDATGENVLTKEQQQEIYESYDYCVSRRGPEDIYGVGNYVVPILRNDNGKIGFNVWCLDSGSNQGVCWDYDYDTSNTEYYSASQKPDSGYDFIKYDQQLWYWNTSTMLENYNGSSIPGAMFAHIPLPEFWDVYNNRSDASVEYFGDYGEPVSCSAKNSHMFDTILARGDVKGFYCGHDHVNTFEGKWQGIELAYDGALTTDNYGNYNESPNTQGGRLFVINQDDAANYTSEFISYNSVKESKVTDSIGNAPFSGDLQTFEGSLPAYTSTGWNGDECRSPATLALANGKGFSGTTAVAITKGGDKSYNDAALSRIDNCELKIDVNNAQVGENKYLRVWVDFTGVDFRKANFGVVTSDGKVYCSDEIDGNNGLEFYTLADGDTRWSQKCLGDDGNFGTQQATSMSNFKGWMAFPIDTFGLVGNGSTRVPSTATVDKVYYFFDYSSLDMVGSTFYMDEMGIVPEYWVF